MDRPHLKPFDPGAPKEKSTRVGEANVTVSVGDLLPLLADAWQSKRAWLNDFSSDRVIISQDMYEVLLAYKRMTRTQAA